MGIRAHTVATLLALAALAVEWPVWLIADLCGNEDTVECTATGWVLLVTWMVLVVAVGLLAVTLAARVVIGRLRRR